MKRKMVRRTINDQMLEIYHDYIEEHGRKPVSNLALYEWAKSTRRWAYEPSPAVERNRFSEQLANALRQQIYIDPQGREVRTKHAVRKEINDAQVTMWGDLRYDPIDFIKMSFSQCRKQIVDDNVRLKTDVDSFNENRKPAEPYQLVLDYTEDVAERETGERIRTNSSAAGRERPSSRSRAASLGSDSSHIATRP